MYFILGDRLAIAQDRKTKPSEEEFARSACMHVAIMGEAQCMMIEAGMLSANDHETSLVMCVCVYDFFVTFYNIEYSCKPGSLELCPPLNDWPRETRIWVESVC